MVLKSTTNSKGYYAQLRETGAVTAKQKAAVIIVTVLVDAPLKF